MTKRLRFFCVIIMTLLLVSIAACETESIETDTSESIMATEPETLTETNCPTDLPTNTPTESNTDVLTEIPTDLPTEASTQSPTEEPTQTEPETEHTHDWVEADCTTPKTCAECGEIEGEALGHTGGTATCRGRAKCDRCKKVYGKVGDHLYEGKVTTSVYLVSNATMNRPAVYYYSCIYCGEKGKDTFTYGGSIVEELGEYYKGKLEDGMDTDGYMYFSDPHPVNRELDAAFENGTEARFEKLAEYYGYIKPRFAVCGGDWLNNSNSKESAIAILGYIRAKTRAWFGECYLVVGNHDYNYQIKNESGQTVGGPYKLTPEEITAAWFPEYGKTYYTFTSETSRYYVFDSGIDWGHNVLTELDKEQIVWYLGQLTDNDDKHIVLMPHMMHLSRDMEEYNAATLEYAKISTVYNDRGMYTYNGVTYDFSQKTGMVEYIIAGHNHSDHTGMIEGIPYVLTATNQSGDPANADFVYADYEARKLYLMRIGGASDREIDLLPISE